MSLLIEGMDMPKDCAVCPCCVDVGQGDETEYFCSAEDCAPDIQDITAGRLQTCPLVEIPTPHGRLIDADEFFDKAKEYLSNSRNDFYRVAILQIFKDILNSTETVIEAEGKS